MYIEAKHKPELTSNCDVEQNKSWSDIYIGIAIAWKSCCCLSGTGTIPFSFGEIWHPGKKATEWYVASNVGN